MTLTAKQLTRAARIAGRIEGLQRQLNTLLPDSNPKPPRKKMTAAWRRAISRGHHARIAKLKRNGGKTV